MQMAQTNFSLSNKLVEEPEIAMFRLPNGLYRLQIDTSLEALQDLLSKMFEQSRVMVALYDRMNRCAANAAVQERASRKIQLRRFQEDALGKKYMELRYGLNVPHRLALKQLEQDPIYHQLKCDRSMLLSYIKAYQFKQQQLTKEENHEQELDGHEPARIAAVPPEESA